MRIPNYDKTPCTVTEGEIIQGWEAITSRLKEVCGSVIAVDLYSGTYETEISRAFSGAGFDVVLTRNFMKPQEQILEMTGPFMTDDVLFGHLSFLELEDFFPSVRREIPAPENGHRLAVIGTGASLFVPEGSVIVYADMARWEIQRRCRLHSVTGIGVDNRQDAPSVQYKRGLFIDWPALDRYKDRLFPGIGWFLDTNIPDRPKMIDSATFMRGIEKTSRSPFRVVPFFDPSPWGGQWMKTVCDLPGGVPNYGWCFDCVPEENSLYLNVDGVNFEIPSQDLILLRSREVLGEPVEARFGKSFPIRFDFLDTMDGGNLSLQVHPGIQYMRDNFGFSYTQDESYYLLDAGEDACVFLGLKNGADCGSMIEDLTAIHASGGVFDADRYVNRIPARKHDHFLIPAGTVHCSGRNAMVLEISATPSIFTFKLWDWNRMGLDGKPRPINVKRGAEVIRRERDTDFVMEELYNHFRETASGEGWSEISTGLHPNEFIETRRVSFTGPFIKENPDSVHVLNLVEGEEAVVESPDGTFDPFTVHYAETFIIPAACRRYSIRPCGRSEGSGCMVIIAYVRHNV